MAESIFQGNLTNGRDGFEKDPFFVGDFIRRDPHVVDLFSVLSQTCHG
jgi:hypothetical protein